MIDFAKRLANKKTDKKVHPVEIYQDLDRASDKGPLRPAQEAVLNEWFEKRRNSKETILKLHTGQGKTLIGLLLLQSKLNEGKGPALYLCPNHQLVQQTCDQAKQFGVTTVADTEDGELPQNFLDGSAIYVTTVQKLFNGLTKFKLSPRSVKVGAIVVDDAHACVEEIQGCSTIEVPHTSEIYRKIFSIFEADIESQGAGTISDIRNKMWEALAIVPYWAWSAHTTDVSDVLSSANKDRDKAVIFAWPLIKDILPYCRCIISGVSLEISPYLFPLDRFGSFFEADTRVYMSATLADDSALIKGLRLDEKTIREPLKYPGETWSGEKMILIPSLIDDSLTRTEVVNLFAKPAKKRLGIVALVASSSKTGDWKAYGATIASKNTIDEEIEKLVAGQDCSQTLVIVNRYDGIDLADHACRILVLDSKPFFEPLADRYIEARRQDSDMLVRRIAQRIEQGMGRGVRGEKDYCAVVITGPDLVRVLRSKETQRHFSSQTRAQIEIGQQIIDFAKEELENKEDPKKLLVGTIQQLLNRDQGWKDFYSAQMDALPTEEKNGDSLQVFSDELLAEIQHLDGDHEAAVHTIQSILDENQFSKADRGWYLQEMARYKHPVSAVEGNLLQISAHSTNRTLLSPKSGMAFVKMETLPQKRTAAIRTWLQEHGTYQQASLALDEVLTDLAFGVKADKFEAALARLGSCLGFPNDRPDNEWKAGPDNLWLLKDGEYLLIECKNMVAEDRSEIYKSETGQMSNACAWFERNYPGAKVHRMMIIPTNRVSRAAGFLNPVTIMREKGLRQLSKAVRSFFGEFRNIDFRDLDEAKIAEALATHTLTSDDLVSVYSEAPREY